MKLDELKKVYIKQMERIEGAKARKLDSKTYESWWIDGVKKYGYMAQDIEYAATEICESSDAFPILSTFIFHCSAGRRKRQQEEQLEEKRQEAKARDLSSEAIFDRGAKTARSPKAQAVIKNAQRFLKGEISRKEMAKNQDEIEKGG